MSNPAHGDDGEGVYFSLISWGLTLNVTCKYGLPIGAHFRPRWGANSPLLNGPPIEELPRKRMNRGYYGIS